MEFNAPAKLNLFFRVLRKRADGYHEIASLYQAVDLFDRLFFDYADQDLLTCTDPAIPTDSSNLVTKALQLFRTEFPFSQKVKIHIEKKIPIQAGLGGGSSNAATTLWALNEMTGKPASLQQLIAMGSTLGSDVPFFFSSGTAYCTGRGEILEPVTLPRPISGWIAKPSFGLSTPLVYKNTVISELVARDPLEALQKFPTFFNDLEVPAFHLEPRLKEIKQTLKESFHSVTMTGSGTAFFCLEGTPSPFEDLRFFPFHNAQRTNSWY